MWWDRIFGATSGGAGEGAPHDADRAGDEGIVVEPADDTSTAPDEDATTANEEDSPDEDAAASEADAPAETEGETTSGAGGPSATDGGTAGPADDDAEPAEDDEDEAIAVGTDASPATDRWAGEDPISFSEEPEAGALLDAVNVDGADSAPSGTGRDGQEAAGSEEGDVTDDPEDEAPSGHGQGDASDAGSELDPGADESTSDRPATAADGEPASDGSGGDESTGGGSGGDDVEEAAADDAPAAGADDRVEAAASDAARLRSRLDAVEEGHERISETVGDLESEVAAVHDRIDGVHEDVERLVGLVKEAAPTRGGSAATTASPDVELSPTAPVATDRDATDCWTGDRAGADVGEAERQSDDDSQDGEDDSQSTAEESQTDASAPGDPSPRTDGSSAVPPAGADPRSDAAAERLREYQGRFESGEPTSAVGGTAVFEDESAAAVGDDGSGVALASDVAEDADDAADAADADDTDDAADAADADDTDDAADASVLDRAVGEFEFEKVLVPADGDGEAEVIGGVLEPPYLDDVPDGYAEEAAVIEWLDGIVETADEQTAVDALAYYESIGWLGTTVRERLSQYLSGLEHVTEPEPPVGPPEDLDREDHRRSFEYVTRLATGEVEPDGI